MSDRAFDDFSPSGVGLVTVISNEPGLTISDEVMRAVSSVSDTKVVVLSELLNLTFEVGKNFLPLTLKLNPGSPAWTKSGEIEVITGVG